MALITENHPANCTGCAKGWRPHPTKPDKHLDPETRIAPMAEWGAACARGFVSDSRFDPNATVIPRTNRQTSRKWRKVKKSNDTLPFPNPDWNYESAYT